jgi:hypothetical protein
MASPNGLARSMTRTLVEITRERWQARHQRIRGLEPRVARGWTFALLRAVTNGVLRDLNTALVSQEMRRGARSIFVDYVDYDEVAHHAGVSRPESLAALDALDRVLASLEQLATRGAREYKIVVLSDHGQSQGEPFAERYGSSLADVCESLMAEQVTSVDVPVEGLGRAQAVTGEASKSRGVGRLAARADADLERRRGEQDLDAPSPVVLGSGNLGLLFLPGPGRLTLQGLDEAWPRLVPGLAEHPGVMFVAGTDDDGTPWAVGGNGRRNLATDEVLGDDPLASLDPRAARLLARAVLLPEAPDLYVNSMFDPETNEVAPFEELVGAHGGLGGWQDRAVLMVPGELAPLLPERIVGADALHDALVSMLIQAGHRKNLA